MNVKTHSLKLISLLLISVLTGCGGGGGGGGDDPTATPIPPPGGTSNNGASTEAGTGNNPSGNTAPGTTTPGTAPSGNTTPTPGTTPPGNSTGSNAVSPCFNPVLYTQGTTYRFDYLNSTGLKRSTELLSITTGTYQGRTGVVDVHTKNTLMTPMGTIGGEMHSFNAPLSGAELVLYGNTGENHLIGALVSTSSQEYDPPWRQKMFTLTVPGQVDEVALTIHTTANNVRKDELFRWKATYLGQETVTVPAGTFEGACKFTIEDPSTPDFKNTAWYAKGSGVPIKSTGTTEEGSYTDELLASSHLNGQAVH